MRRLVRVLGLAIGAFVLVAGGAFALIESGEVIVLRGTSAEGGDFIARLWIVDHAGHQWIGKADPSKARWVARLRSNSKVEVTRGNVSECREAVLSEDPETRREVYSLIQSKYRIPLHGARALGFLFGGNPDPAEAARSGVLFRLDPCTRSR